MRAEEREETVAVLREQLRAADAGIETPDDLWERVRAPRESVTGVGTGAGAAGTHPPRLRRRPLPFAVIGVAAAAVVLVVCGAWWLVAPSGTGPDQGTSPARPPGDTITLRVFNAEKPCRSLHTIECSLRIAKNPYTPYADPANAAGRAWHGDRLSATCVVTDAQTITDEAGLSSPRWYRVEKTGAGSGDKAVEGWLPGVRTRNSTEVPLCSGAEKPPRKGS